jgi:hypothetical protein
MNLQIKICKTKNSNSEKNFVGAETREQVRSGINQTLTIGGRRRSYDGFVEGQAAAFTFRAARQSRANLFEVGADEVDQIFRQLRSDLFLGAVGEMKADVRFKHLAHEAVDASTNGGKEHQLAAAVFIGGERTLDGVELAAQFAQALKQLHFFPFVVRHGAFLRLDNTHPGYGINPMGV